MKFLSFLKWVFNFSLVIVVLIGLSLLLANFWKFRQIVIEEDPAQSLAGVTEKRSFHSMASPWLRYNYHFYYKDDSVMVNQHFVELEGVHFNAAATIDGEADQAHVRLIQDGKPYTYPIPMAKHFIPLPIAGSDKYIVAVLVGLSSLAWVFLVLLLLLRLRKLIDSFLKGQYFTQKNMHIIQQVGWIFVLAPLVEWVFRALLLALFYQTPNVLPENWKAYSDLAEGVNYGLLLSGLVILAISKAFAEGIKLQEDAKFTI